MVASEQVDLDLRAYGTRYKVRKRLSLARSKVETNVRASERPVRAEVDLV